jgi:biopolymer transport protein ExbD
MSGSQNIGESSDNPVEINVVAMVDVIFCLCLFFMCSMHFKQLEGKIDTWLPKERGVNQAPVDKVVLEEIRVFMKWDATSGATIRKVGNRGAVDSDQQLMETILSMTADYKKAGKSEFPVLIDATADVPWKDVIHVMDLCKGENIERIEFAAPFEYTGAPAPKANP